MAVAWPTKSRQPMPTPMLTPCSHHAHTMLTPCSHRPTRSTRRLTIYGTGFAADQYSGNTAVFVGPYPCMVRGFRARLNRLHDRLTSTLFDFRR
eukprot:360749-Chlamydomonas_euryale.AAC.2